MVLDRLKADRDSHFATKRYTVLRSTTSKIEIQKHLVPTFLYVITKVDETDTCKFIYGQAEVL